MHLIPYLAVCFLTTVSISGCTGGLDEKPNAKLPPEIGASYRYLDREVNQILDVTYKGLDERRGRTWYHFEHDSFPYPIESLAYIDTETGGLPSSPGPHLDFYEAYAEPFMEWHRRPGSYVVEDAGPPSEPSYRYEIDVQQQDGKRLVHIVYSSLRNEDKGRITNEVLVTYDPQDVLPLSIERKAARNDDGSWDYISKIERVAQ